MSWIEIIADRKIRDAQEEGAFDNLEGKGKPLRLDSDPRVPPEQRAAYRLMKEAGLLPDWIQLDKEIREREARWREQFDEIDEIDDRRIDALLMEAARGLRELNEQIERLNLIVPAASRQRVVIDVRRRMEELEARFPRRHPRVGPAPWEALLPETKPPTRMDGRLPIRLRRGAFG